MVLTRQQCYKDMMKYDDDLAVKYTTYNITEAVIQFKKNIRYDSLILKATTLGSEHF